MNDLAEQMQVGTHMLHTLSIFVLSFFEPQDSCDTLQSHPSEPIYCIVASVLHLSERRGALRPNERG